MQIEATLAIQAPENAQISSNIFQYLPYIFSIKENNISPFLAIYGKWIKTRAFASAIAPEI